MMYLYFGLAYFVFFIIFMYQCYKNAEFYEEPTQDPPED